MALMAPDMRLVYACLPCLLVVEMLPDSRVETVNSQADMFAFTYCTADTSSSQVAYRGTLWHSTLPLVPIVEHGGGLLEAPSFSV